MGAYAQDAQQVSADAAQAVNDAPASETKAPKPSNWTNSLKTNVTVGQPGLTNWAAGGDNTVSMLHQYTPHQCSDQLKKQEYYRYIM